MDDTDRRLDHMENSINHLTRNQEKLQKCLSRMSHDTAVLQTQMSQYMELMAVQTELLNTFFHKEYPATKEEIGGLKKAIKSSWTILVMILGGILGVGSSFILL